MNQLLDPKSKDKLIGNYMLLQQKLGGIGASAHAAKSMLKSL
jgi:hypothetical protein